MIMKFFQGLRKQQELKKHWLEFYVEVDKNLESYYVMFQLDRLRFFNLEVWERIKNNADVRMTSDVLRYTEILNEYNKTLKSFKDYEEWYSSDLKNKIPENGRILYAKKDEAQEKFQRLENIIKRAQQNVRQQLMDLKIMKSVRENNLP